MVDILLTAARKNVSDGDRQLAVGLFEQALTRLEYVHGVDNKRLVAVLADLTSCYEAEGLTSKADQCRARLSELARPKGELGS